MIDLIDFSEGINGWYNYSTFLTILKYVYTEVSYGERYKDIFVGRQPILDPNGDIYGYELLYRNSIETFS